MTKRRNSTGHFGLPIPATEAINLFTPEGERAWVPGWDPTYPTGEASETPGTVFTTSHGDTQTIWVIQQIDRVARTAAYSRVTVGHHAGTVWVRCEDQANGQCLVSVEYDMSLLPGSDPAVLDAYSDPSFAAMMNEWATRTRNSL